MKKIQIFFICTVLSLSVLFTGFGYAAITTNLQLHGNANLTMQKGVFIAALTPTEGEGATQTLNSCVQATMNTTLTLGPTSGSTVSYRVRLYNNSATDMAYNDTASLENAYDNQNIAFAVTGVSSGDVIKAHGELFLTITFSFKGGTVAASKTLNSVIGFRFGEVIIFDPGHFEPGENYNQLVAAILSNANGYGLNDSHKGDVLHAAIGKDDYLYSFENIQGGNLKKMVGALQTTTKNIDFVFEYISDSEYVCYLFDGESPKAGDTITVYKQHLVDNGTKWVAGTALVGTATFKKVSGSSYSILPSEWLPTPARTA